jgi:hypothetical protein
MPAGVLHATVVAASHSPAAHAAELLTALSTGMSAHVSPTAPAAAHAATSTSSAATVAASAVGLGRSHKDCKTAANDCHAEEFPHAATPAW